MRKTVILVLLLSASATRAQQTPVSATVRDPSGNPYTFSTGYATIQCPGNQQPTTMGGSPLARTITIVGFDGFGHFSMVLWDVNGIIPTGCGWKFMITWKDSLTSFTTGTIGQAGNPPVITGPANVDLSAAISAFAVPLPLPPPPSGGSVTSVSTTEQGMDPLVAISTTNPTTTPNINFAATTVAPAAALIGPPLPVGAVNPSFETSNNNVSAVTVSPITLTGTSLAATSSAVIFGFTGAGAVVNAPDGTWTSLGTNTVFSNFFYKNFTSIQTNLSTSQTYAGGAQTWVANMAFFGGGVTSIPHRGTFGGGGGTCLSGEQACVSVTLNPVTAGNTLIANVTTGSAQGCQGFTGTASDNQGNSWTRYAVPFEQSVTTPQCSALFTASNVKSGSTTITIHGNTPLIANFSGGDAIEVAGIAPYFSGPTGPWGFRGLASGDLAGISVTNDAVGLLTAPNVVGWHFATTRTPLGSTAPSTNQMILWNGTNIVGQSPAGDLANDYSSPQVTALHFGATQRTLSGTAPTTGQFLQYNGTNIVGTTIATTYTNSGTNSSVCTTAAAAGSTCTTTVTLTNTEADTNYKAAIGCVSPTQFPFILGFTKTTTSVTVTIANGTANEAQASTCASLDVVITR